MENKRFFKKWCYNNMDIHDENKSILTPTSYDIPPQKKSRCFSDQNEKAKAIMLLGENIGEYLGNLRVREGFWTEDKKQ